VNLLSAIFSGRIGFSRVLQSQASHADRIARAGYDEEAQNKLPEDLVGLKLDTLAAKANLNTIRVSDDIVRELMKIGK